MWEKETRLQIPNELIEASLDIEHSFKMGATALRIIYHGRPDWHELRPKKKYRYQIISISKHQNKFERNVRESGM